MSGIPQQLFLRMITKFVLFLALIGLMLFLPAGSLNYANGWMLVLALALPMAAFGLFLFIRDRATLERRLASKEPSRAQRANIALSAIMFLGTFVLAGLDFRLGWSHMPLAVSAAAVLVLLIGYALFIKVILQNAYASRVVDVFEGQKLITNGLYAVVRHPMYLATLLIFLPIPVILGSWFALIPMAIYPVILVRRICDEEALLHRELPGYAAYQNVVRHRLLPFIW